MKFTVNRTRFVDAVGLACGVIPVRTVKPVLMNVRLTLDEAGITIVGTDLEVAVRVRLEAERIVEQGDILLPANRLLSIIREAESETLTCTCEDMGFTIQSGKNTSKVMAEPKGDYPEIDTVGDTTPLIMPRDDLRRLIRKTVFATAKEKTRYAFNGVRFETAGNECRMIGTDGRRMAIMMVLVENPDGIEAGHIIPTKGLSIIDRVVADGGPEVKIHLLDRMVVVSTGSAEVSSRLVEGAFPRYESVIPRDTRSTATFEKAPLLSALRQANVLTNEESRAIRISFEADRAIMTSRTMDVGESRVEVEGHLEGEPMEANFNGDFLIEGIKQMDSHRVVFQLSGRDTPSIVEGEENFLYVVMPVTVRTA
ncbi:MAG TPA: DNA polymerase III subunit beta [Planctomycetota bacterium]|jgi:DNA polymerase-3 subunit beta|nr:DNA polymerase III subunit beta [Planctomycetota bacterium]